MLLTQPPILRCRTITCANLLQRCALRHSLARQDSALLQPLHAQYARIVRKCVRAQRLCRLDARRVSIREAALRHGVLDRRCASLLLTAVGPELQEWKAAGMLALVLVFKVCSMLAYARACVVRTARDR